MEISNELREKIEAKKKTHIFYDEWCEWFIGLNPADVAELAKGIAYAFRGEDYQSPNMTANTLLKVARPLIEANREVYVNKVAKQIDGVNKRWSGGREKQTNSQVIVNYKPTNSQHIANGSDIELDLDIDRELDIDRDISSGLKRPSDISSQKRGDFVSKRKEEVEAVLQAWNSIPNIPSVKMLDRNTDRYKMLCARLDKYGLDAVLDAVNNIRHSTFLCGGGDKGWHIDFGWFVRPNNFPKVYEGKYSDTVEEHLPKVSRAISVIDDMIAKGLISNDG